MIVSEKTATKARAIEDMTAAEVDKEIRWCMARLAKLHAVLVEWARNSEELLEAVIVEPVGRRA